VSSPVVPWFRSTFSLLTNYCPHNISILSWSADSTQPSPNNRTNNRTQKSQLPWHGADREHRLRKLFCWCFTQIPQRTLQAAEVEVKLRPTVSQPVSLGIRHPSGTSDQFFFLLEIFFRQLRVCYFVAPSLMTGRVCNLLLLLPSNCRCIVACFAIVAQQTGVYITIFFRQLRVCYFVAPSLTRGRVCNLLLKLLGNCLCIVACFAIVAQQRVYIYIHTYNNVKMFGNYIN
jgi:hypothetical protein